MTSTEWTEYLPRQVQATSSREAASHWLRSSTTYHLTPGFQEVRRSLSGLLAGYATWKRKK